MEELAFVAVHADSIDLEGGAKFRHEVVGRGLFSKFILTMGIVALVAIFAFPVVHIVAAKLGLFLVVVLMPSLLPCILLVIPIFIPSFIVLKGQATFAIIFKLIILLTILRRRRRRRAK